MYPLLVICKRNCKVEAVSHVSEEMLDEIDQNLAKNVTATDLKD